MSKLLTIQVLRGVAATAVAGMHMAAAARVEGYEWVLGSVFAHGEAGVDVFFVISGFIIYVSSVAKKGRSPAEFLANRFWRVVPPYWAVLVFYLAGTLGLALVLGDTGKLPDITTILTSVLLLPMGFEDYVLGIAWTLSLEIIFYLVFAVTFLVFGWRSFLIAMLLWYGLALLNLVLADEDGIFDTALNTVIIEFLMGALIARFYLSGKSRFHGPAFAIGLILFLALVAGFIAPENHIRREFIYGIPAAFLVYGAVGLDKIKWPSGLVLWGESSYLLYLMHVPIYAYVGRGIEEVTGINVYGSNVGATALFLFSIVLCCWLTIWIERPYQAWYRRRIRAKG